MNKYLLSIKLENHLYSFYSKNNNKNNLYNILATISLSINIYFDVIKIK